MVVEEHQEVQVTTDFFIQFLKMLTPIRLI